MNLFILLNLVGLFRTVIFLLAVYFIIKLFTRYVLPLIVENKIKQMQQNMNDRNHKYSQPNKREGDVTIDYGNQNPNVRHKPDEGEYVDFEEVE